MKTDSLKRRLRTAAPQPKDRHIALSDNDIQIFESIHRHGPLPSHYIHALSAKKNYTAHQHRLTKLFNGARRGLKTENYLTKPDQQFMGYASRYQPLIYDLNEKAIQLLAEHGKLSPFINRTDLFFHRFMGACVSASIEVACRENGIRYIPRHEVLSRKGNEMSLPLSPLSGQSALVPDDVFGLDYGGAYRFFAVEIDRNTESIERKNLAQSSFGKKVQAYADVLQNRTYKDVWGIPNMMVLTVTTSATHMKKILTYVAKNPFPERFLFKAKPDFGTNWRVPDIMTDLLTEPWNTTKGAFDISTR